MRLNNGIKARVDKGGWLPSTYAAHGSLDHSALALYKPWVVGA